jgi:RsiW-degrading membrane proteinase PrsW (M82 family)
MIQDLLANPFQLLAVTFLAAAPILIWFFFLFSGRKVSRKTLIFSFFLGTLTVIPLQVMNYLWFLFPELNIDQLIQTSVQSASISTFLTLLFSGAAEEFAKSGVVRFVDRTKIGVQNINDAIKYSIMAGLGFAFIENIVYFYFFWLNSGFLDSIPAMIARSTYTVCGHIVFSGIFGYYHGISKFSKPIMETKQWMGEEGLLIRALSKMLKGDGSKVYRKVMLIKGLFIAMLLHAFFNTFLEFEMLWAAVAILVIGFTYLMYLRAHKAGAIAFAGMGRPSTFAKKDEDVVIELLGLWTQEGRYKDVVDICQRLLMRDPDNKVVQLFQAKAMDKQKLSNLESSISSLFNANDQTKEDRSMRTLMKQKVLMEMLKEKTQTVAPVPHPPVPAPQPAPVSQPTPAPVPSATTPPIQNASPTPIVQNDPSSLPNNPAPQPAPLSSEAPRINPSPPVDPAA